MKLTTFVLVLVAVVTMGYAGGCSGRPQLFPNSDPALNKPSTAFAADAGRRFPYKLDAPRAGFAEARAQVGYSLDVLELVNLSSEDWTDIEVWVNQQYVVHLPTLERNKLKRMTFQMLFNEGGYSFPTDNIEVMVEKLELYRDGKMYDVKLQLAD